VAYPATHFSATRFYLILRASIPRREAKTLAAGRLEKESGGTSVSAVAAVAMIVGGLLYIHLRWHRSPQAYRAMLILAGCYLVSRRH
jgi:hypothetical protein